MAAHQNLCTRILDISSPCSPLEIPWTASRCNRLLRPITSRLQALRKSSHVEVFSTSQTGNRVKLDHIRQTRKGDLSTGQDENASDSDWAAFKPRKRVKHRYRAKPASNKEEHERYQNPSDVLIAAEAGNIIVPTPFLIRSLPPPSLSTTEQHESSTQVPARVTDCCKVLYKKSGYNQDSSVISGLCSAINKLYSNTSGLDTEHQIGPTSRRLGTRSLFSACLRSVPHYIQSAELVSGDDSMYSEDNTSTQTYAILEENECVNGKGWPPLQQVVRSHGLYFLKAAILEGTLDAAAVSALIRQFRSTGHNEDAWILRETFTTAHASWSSTDHGQGNVFGSVISLIQSSPDKLTHICCIHKLLSCGKLNALWLATNDAGKVWVEIIKSLSQDDSASNVSFQLVELFLTLALDLEEAPEQMTTMATREYSGTSKGQMKLETALENRVASLCRILVTIGMGDEHKRIGQKEMQLPNVIRGIKGAIVNFVQAGGRSRRPIIAGIIMTTDLVFELARLRKDSDTTSLRVIRKVTWIISHMQAGGLVRNDTPISFGEYLSNFISSIASSWGKATRGNGFTLLKQIVQWLMDPKLENPGGFETDGREISIELLVVRSASMFAQRSKSPKDLDFVRQLETPAARQRYKTRCSNKHQNRTLFARFRWEEGINEWVATTPVRKSCTDQHSAPSAEVRTASICSTSRVEIQDPKQPRIAQQTKSRKLLSTIQVPTVTMKRNHEGTLSLEQSTRQKRHLGRSTLLPGLQDDDDVDELSGRENVDWVSTANRSVVMPLTRRNLRVHAI